MILIEKKMLPAELDLQTVLGALKQANLSRLVVEQQNALGESRWFLIQNHDFHLSSIGEMIDSNFTTARLMPKGTRRTRSWIHFDGRIPSFLTIRFISVSDSAPKQDHLAVWKFISGVMLEREQAIYINLSDSKRCNFNVVLSLLPNLEESSSSSSYRCKASPVEIEFQPRVGSAAIPSSWTRILGVTGFKLVKATPRWGKTVTVVGIKLYFSGLGKPIVCQTIPESAKFLENKLEKNKVIFELELSKDWEENPEIMGASIDWVSGNVQFNSENLQFTNTIRQANRCDSADKLRNQIYKGNVKARICGMSWTVSQFTLAGLKNFVYGETLSSFSFSSCKLFSDSPDAYYWWLEGEKDNFEAKWGLEPQKPTATLEDFKEEGVLGRGSIAVVTLVNYKDTYYAKKSVDLSVPNLDMEQRLNEKKILETIDFKFLVSLQFYFNQGNKMHFVMNFVRGGELFYLLVEESKFSEDACRFYGAQMVLVLEYLHKNDIVYRDLTTKNTLIEANGYLRLADLGLAVKLETNGRTMAASGTPAYMAPEAILPGDIGCGKGIDSWSLGVTLYNMLTGFEPFSHEVKEKLDSEILNAKVVYADTISPEAKCLLQRLLERNVSERLTIEEVKKDPWFSVVDWDAIYNMKVEAPYTPILDPKDLTRHFTQKAETIADVEDVVEDGVEDVVENFPVLWNKRSENINWTPCSHNI